MCELSMKRTRGSRLKVARYSFSGSIPPKFEHKLRRHKQSYWRKKLPWMILEEQFPVPIYTAVSKIGNSVISLLWQLRCHCNPDHNKFSSLSNTTVVAIFPNLCLWRRSLFSNLGGIDPEKLYRDTLKRSAKFHLLMKSCHLRDLFCKLLMNGIITALCGITLSWLLTILNLLGLFLKATASARM